MFYDQISNCFKIRGMEYVPVILRPSTNVFESIGMDGTVGVINEEHERCFSELIEASKTSMEDAERLQMLYVFSCPYFQESCISFRKFSIPRQPSMRKKRSGFRIVHGFYFKKNLYFIYIYIQ